MVIPIFLLLLSLFHTCLGLTCADLAENQCKQLQNDGCTWSNTICKGTYSPACIPPSCYYIDSSSTDTATPTGTPAKPLKTLSTGFIKLSGVDGTLIIINRFEGKGVNVTQAHSPTSNITIRPLFDDTRYKIDVSNLQSSARTVFTVKKYLKVIGASLTIDFPLSANIIFYAVAGQIYLEDMEFMNIISSSSSTILLAATSSSSTSIISLANSRIANVSTFFRIVVGQILWENVYVSGLNSLTISLSYLTAMTMKDCFFTGTLTGLLISSSLQEQIELRNCTFRELTMNNLFSTGSTTTIRLKDSTFDQIVSTARQGLFSLKTVGNQPLVAVVENCSFANIQTLSPIFGLQGPYATLSLINVRMANLTQIMSSEIGYGSINLKSTVSWFQGLCVASVGNTEIVIESSNFTNIGSSCFWFGDTDLNLTNSRFDNSGFDVKETSIVRDDKSSLTEDSGNSWVRIKTTTSYEKQVSQAVITNNKFIQNKFRPKFGGAIRVTGVFASEVRIIGNEFIENTAYYGGAIYSDNAFASLDLNDNTFNDNSAFNGGAIYKTSTESDEKLLRVSLSTDNDQFLGNTAVKNGGAIYLNWELIYFSNTEFLSNQAVNGGAIYFINLDEVYQNKYGGLKNVDFIENSASNVGGSMKLFFEYSSMIKMTDRVLVFKDNLDFANSKEGISQGRPAYYFFSFYDIISQTQPKVTDNLQDWIDNSDLTKLAFTMNTSETMVEFPDIQQKSGNELSQIMKVQITMKRQVTFEIASNENNISNYAAFLAYEPIKFQFDRGQFLAKGIIKIHGDPKTTAVLRLENILDFSDFIQDSGMTGSFDLQVRFVDCEIGDVFATQTRSCSTCAVGSFTIDDPYKATYCSECPENLECFGGSKIGPMPGYWMYNLKAVTAIKCPYSSACLGSLSNYSVQGECLYPYQGNLCNQCTSGYAKFGNSARCRNCQNDVMYYVRFILFFLIQVAVVLFIHKLNYGKQSQRSTLYLNVIKILVSFIQMSSVIISYDLNWSVLSKDAIDILNKIFPSDKDGFPIDCLLALVFPNNDNINFARLVMTFFQPFILWGLCILAYSLIPLCSARRSKDFGEKMKSSKWSLFVISVFIVQPNIIRTALELFKCQNISSPESRELFLTSNFDMRCWTRSHMIWGYGFALPMFLIWGVILPFVLFAKTSIYGNSLGSWKPFFYQGLRKETFYWEFIVTIIKTLVILVFTVFTSTSEDVQILITLLICLSFTVLFLRIHPYQDPRLHFSSLLSLLALTFMCYVGFFFLSKSWSDAQVTVTSVLLVVLNCTVFIYPIFSIIKDRVRTQIVVEEAKPTLAVPDTERVLSGKTEEEKTNADESVVHNLSNHEIKIRETVRSAKKEDNFTIMQRSGLRLLSSSTSTKHLSALSPDSREETIFPRGDFLSSSSTRHKKIYMKRLNMKTLIVVDNGNIKLENTENTERTVTENVKTEVTISTPGVRTQGEPELENLLNLFKHGSVVSKSSE